MSRYLLEERVGHGAMGEIWRASRRLADGSRDTVAVKFGSEERATAPTAPALPELVARFEREARVCMAMHHEHVIQVFDWDVIDDR